MIQFSFKFLLRAASLGCSHRGQSCFSCEEAQEPEILLFWSKNLLGVREGKEGWQEKNRRELGEDKSG